MKDLLLRRVIATRAVHHTIIHHGQYQFKSTMRAAFPADLSVLGLPGWRETRRIMYLVAIAAPDMHSTLVSL